MQVPPWRRHGDVMVALALFLLAQVELGARHPAHDLIGLLRSVVLAAATLPLALRRSRPLFSVLTVTVVGSVAIDASGNPDSFYAVAAAALIGFYSAGAYATRRSWVALLVGLVSFWVGDVLADHPPSEYVASAILVAGPWLAGVALRHQRTQSAELRRLAVDLAEQRTLAEHAAAATERARIASEMHDVVAHTLSVIAVQADAAGAALAVEPTLAADAVDSIRDVSREALGEMRRVLQLVHEHDDPPLSPPTLRDVDRLVAQVSSAGLVVYLHTSGELAGLPGPVDLAAYRVIQEALTNARKHSSGRHAKVTVARAGGRLCLEVLSDGPALRTVPGTSGYGLRGLRDRVEAHGGRFEAGAVNTGWRVAAAFPAPAVVRP